MKKILLIIFILILPSFASGAPIISGTSGSFSNGGSVRVSGSGFGAKANPKPLKFETFEKNDSGNETVVNNTVPLELSYWTGRGGTSSSGHSKDLTISDNNPRHLFSKRGAQAYLSREDGVDVDAQQIWHNDIGFSETGKIYLNMWIYCNWVSEPIYRDEYTYYQIKYFNVSTAHLSNGDPVRPYITEFVGFMYDYPHYLGYTQNYHRNGRVSHPDQSFYYNNSSIPNNFSGWVNVVFISEPGTNDDEALSTDGWRIIQISSPDFLSPYQSKVETGKNYLDDETKGIHPINSLKIGWYLGNNLKTGNVFLYYDDIYMDNTFSRIEIGDSSTYENCTHREIQIPTQWSDGAVEFSVNQGAFTDRETVYLYVTDASGEVNAEGFPTMINSSDVSSPIAPSGLNVL